MDLPVSMAMFVHSAMTMARLLAHFHHPPPQVGHPTSLHAVHVHVVSVYSNEHIRRACCTRLVFSKSRTLQVVWKTFDGLCSAQSAKCRWGFSKMYHGRSACILHKNTVVSPRLADISAQNIRAHMLGVREENVLEILDQPDDRNRLPGSVGISTGRSRANKCCIAVLLCAFTSVKLPDSEDNKSVLPKTGKDNLRLDAAKPDSRSRNAPNPSAKLSDDRLPKERKLLP